MRSVYLAGPILGTTRESMLGWRLHALKKFRPLQAYSPLRGFEHLIQDNGQFHPDHQNHPLRHPQAFTRRDFWDVRRNDALFCNFLGASRVSIGTCMEIAVARDHHKYIVVVMEPDNIHQYSMILDCASFVETDLDRAIEYTKAALLPDYTPSC
jgi:hypothetical protein